MPASQGRARAGRLHGRCDGLCRRHLTASPDQVPLQLIAKHSTPGSPGLTQEDKNLTKFIASSKVSLVCKMPILRLFLFPAFGRLESLSPLPQRKPQLPPVLLVQDSPQ